VKTLRARKAPLENRVLAAALFSSLCGSLVHALASVSHRTPGVYSVFLFIAGLSAVNASIAGIAPMRSVHLRKMPLRIAAGGLALSAALAALAYYSARPFAGEWRLLRAANAPDRLSAIRLIDSSLEANPYSVYALYDKLKLVLDSDPPGAIALCGRIEALIPGYRRIDRYRGLALETLKDYPGAAGSFRRYIGMDSIEPSTYFHLAASLLMTGDGTGAAACMEDFFLAQHRKSMADRGRIMDLPRIRLVFTDAGESRTFDDGAAGERVCEVSRPFLTALVEALVREKNMGYYSVMLNLYMNVGRLFDEIRYGDLALVYYSMGVDSGMLPADELSFVYGRNRSFESRARELKAMAASSKNATDLYWADVWLATYLRNMNAIRFDEAMNREYEGLLREIEGLRYAKR
jgi:hypothetical protein